MGKLSRRDFNKIFLSTPLLLCPYRFVSQAVAMDSMRKNRAINYVQINLFGAPSRWNFDLVLKPDESSSFSPHPYICTEFSELDENDFKKTRWHYNLHKVNGHWMPPLWKHLIQTPNGKTQASELFMDHMITIRGARMQTDGHETNNRRLVAPIPGGKSFTGLLADKTGMKIPAIQTESDFGDGVSAVSAFRSVKGAPPVNLSTESQYVDDLFGFLKFEERVFKKSKEKQNIIDQAVSFFSSSTNIRESRRNLKGIIEKDFKKIESSYNSLKQKYEKLISSSCYDNSIKNVTDKKIPGFYTSSLTNISELNFIRDIKKEEFEKLSSSHKIAGPYFSDDYLVGNNDMRTVFKKSFFKNMAEQFALTELCLTEEISGVLLMSLNPASNLNYENPFDVDSFDLSNDSEIFQRMDQINKSIKRQMYTFDSHEEGTLVDLIGTTYFYNALMSALGELVNVLKRAGKFDNTVIHIASEFDRDPRMDQTGSDHGWSGVTTSLISGMIHKYQNIGNIYTNSDGKRSLYKNNGTWGEGAPIQELNGKTLNYEDVLTSLCKIYDVDNLSPRSSPIIELEKGRLVTSFSEFKNVEES